MPGGHTFQVPASWDYVTTNYRSVSNRRSQVQGKHIWSHRYATRHSEDLS